MTVVISTALCLFLRFRDVREIMGEKKHRGTRPAARTQVVTAVESGGKDALTRHCFSAVSLIE